MRFGLPRLALSVALLCALPSAAAVSIPDDVAIRAFIKPAGDKLQLLVRVPMAALNQIQFPVLRSGYLDLPRAETALPGAARYWIASSIDLYEDGRPLPRPRVLATRIAIASDDSFASYQQAITHLAGPGLPADTNTFPGQSMLDILFEYSVHSGESGFSISTRFAHLGVRVATTLVYLPGRQAHRTFTYEGDPGAVILIPNRLQTTSQFIRWGFADLLEGTDFLLLLFCLILPFRRMREIIPVGAAFACAIPITLIASASGLAPDTLWFAPLIATLTAISILYTSLENIAGGITPYRRVIVALIIGLICGFGFSQGLAARAQFAGSFPLLSAIAYNSGVEIAIAVVIAILIPALHLLFRFSPGRRIESMKIESSKIESRKIESRKIESMVLSVLAAHTAWHWMTERWGRLSRFPLRWPVLDAALLAAAMRWMMIFVIFGGAVWFISGALRSSSLRADGSEREHEA